MGTSFERLRINITFGQLRNQTAVLQPQHFVGLFGNGKIVGDHDDAVALCKGEVDALNLLIFTLIRVVHVFCL